MFGLPTHPLADAASGTPAQNAETFKHLLASGETIPGHLLPVLDFVLLNASALLVVAGLAEDFVDGVRVAREAIVSGSAWSALVKFREEGRIIAESADA
ncbi:hypothetical protein OF83DRAFT_912183 [Amylostereum chailletii]|nr:hypothetical protein OF83DRAFT_912183 [Amylostereum chailletii]